MSMTGYVWPPKPTLITNRAALERAGRIKLNDNTLLCLDYHAHTLAGLSAAYAEWRQQGVLHRQALKLATGRLKGYVKVTTSADPHEILEDGEDRKMQEAERRRTIRAVYYLWKRRRGKGGRGHYYQEDGAERGTFRAFFEEFRKQAGLLDKRGKPVRGLSDGNVRTYLARPKRKDKRQKRVAS